MIVGKSQKIIPDLRFPEFDGEWAEKRLDDVFDWVKANSLSRQMLTYEGGKVQNIHYGDIHTKFKGQFYQRNEKIPFIKQKALFDDISEEQFCKVGDLVIADASEDYADIGKCIEIMCVREKSLVAGLHTYIARPKDKSVIVGFSGYLFRSRKARIAIMRVAQGISVLGLPKRYLSKITVFLPRPNEQTKIAEFLETVDKKLEALIKKCDLLIVYKRGAMQQIFKQKIRFKTDNGSDFPDWEEKPLGKIADKRRDINTKIESMRVLTNSAIRGVIDQQDYFNKNIANLENLSGYNLIESGDFVYNPRISSNAPVGPINRNNLGKGIMSPLYTVFRFHFEKTKFFELFFHSTHWHSYMRSIANYGARYDRMNITTGSFLKLPLPYPHPDEQQKITEFLSAIDAKIDTVSAQVTQMEAFKRGLLQKMFV